MVLILIIPTSKKRELSTEVRGTPTLGTAYNWCQKHDIYGHRSSGNNLRQGRKISPLLMPIYPEQWLFDGASDDWPPLLCPIDRANVWYPSVDSYCRMKSQLPGGCLSAHIKYDNQSSKLFVWALKHLSDIRLPNPSPRKQDLSCA